MPINDVFSRKADLFGGAFASDQSELTFPGVTGVGQDVTGLLVQNLQTAYNQQVTRLYEVGTPAIYYVGGRTSGNASLQRIIGPTPIQASFYEKYGDLCQAGGNVMQFTMAAQCKTRGGTVVTRGKVHIVMGMCVLTSIGVTMNANDMMINENVQVMFSSMSYNETGQGATQVVGAAA